jgi:hypothetical protein
VWRFNLADISESKQSEVIRLTGGGEQFVADVIQEKGINKLWVKATVAPQILGNLLFEYVKNGGSDTMKVNGSLATPVVFEYKNLTSDDLLVNSLQIEGECGSPSAAGFLGGSALTNGLLIEIKSEDSIFQFLPIKKNYEFDSLFAKGVGANFLIYQGTGADYVGAKFGPDSPFYIRKTGTFASDDYVRVYVRDNLSGSAVTSLKLLVFGAYDV